MCKHFLSDGIGSWQSGAEEYHSGASGKRFPHGTTLLRQGRASPVKVLQISSALHSRQRRSHPNFIQETCWKGRKQEGDCFCDGRRSSKLIRHGAYIGLLRRRSFSKVRIFRVGIGWISIPELWWTQRLAGFHAQGLAGFCAQGLVDFCIELVRDRVCFFGPGFRDRICFFHWLCFQDQIIVFGSGFRVKVCFFGSGFRAKERFFGWPFYPTFMPKDSISKHLSPPLALYSFCLFCIIPCVLGWKWLLKLSCFGLNTQSHSYGSGYLGGGFYFCFYLYLRLRTLHYHSTCWDFENITW